MVAESVMLVEREELSISDYYPTHLYLQKWAYEAGSAYIGDQLGRLDRAAQAESRLKDVGPQDVGYEAKL